MLAIVTLRHGKCSLGGLDNSDVDVAPLVIVGTDVSENLGYFCAELLLPV